MVRRDIGSILSQKEPSDKPGPIHYASKVGKLEWHHIIPKYLGGNTEGPLVQLEAQYHQLITNAFREAWQYGQNPPTAEQLKAIVTTVYLNFPIPLNGWVWPKQ